MFSKLLKQKEFLTREIMKRNTSAIEIARRWKWSNLLFGKKVLGVSINFQNALKKIKDLLKKNRTEDIKDLQSITDNLNAIFMSNAIKNVSPDDMVTLFRALVEIGLPETWEDIKELKPILDEHPERMTGDHLGSFWFTPAEVKEYIGILSAYSVRTFNSKNDPVDKISGVVPSVFRPLWMYKKQFGLSAPVTLKELRNIRDTEVFYPDFRLILDKDFDIDADTGKIVRFGITEKVKEEVKEEITLPGLDIYKLNGLALIPNRTIIKANIIPKGPALSVYKAIGLYPPNIDKLDIIPLRAILNKVDDIVNTTQRNSTDRTRDMVDIYTLLVDRIGMINPTEEQIEILEE